MSAVADLFHEIEDDVDGINPRELYQRIDRARAAQREIAGYVNRLLGRAKQFEAAGQGPPSVDIAKRGGVSVRQARIEDLRVETTRTFPQLGAALNTGQVFSENVDIVGSVTHKITKPEHVAAIREIEAETTEKASRLAPEEFRKWLRAKVADIEADAGLSAFERQRAQSHIKTWWGPDGMLQIHGVADPEWGTWIEAEISARARSLANQRGISPTDQLQAQALAEICRHGAGGPNTRRPPGVLFVMDTHTATHGPHAATVSETISGQPVPPQVIGRVCCDAIASIVELDETGHPLRVGYDHRTATAAQRKALRALYRTCAIDQDTPFDRCEIHHVQFHSTGNGPTNIENLVPLSNHWHHLVHEGGYQLTINPDRSLQIRKPDQTPYKNIPPPKPITRQRE